jgi:hypothetical protein
MIRQKKSTALDKYLSTLYYFMSEVWKSKYSVQVSPYFIKKTKENYVSELLYAIDDAPDFHDPFSDLNLFLSKEIQEHMRSCSCSKKWSAKIQQELLLRIAPKFQKKFPHLRLGVSALRKSWEKIAYYLHQIQNEKEAISQDGRINLPFFIKENLKQLPHLADAESHFHPSLFAHQVAIKMSEYMATIEGTRPKLDYLTKMIWSLQRHLLTDIDLRKSKSPYDDYNKVDKLIVKIILELTAKESHLSQHELEHQVKEALHSFQELPSFSSLDSMTANIAALLSEKLYPTSSFHTLFSPEQKEAILHFIRREIALCKSSYPGMQHTDLVRRILALYTLASQLPKNLSDGEVEEAVKSLYPQPKEVRPEFSQFLFAFISAELVLARNEHYCHSVEYVCKTIVNAYHETKQLPPPHAAETDLLEMVIWKILTESENLLERLPYRVGHWIEEEIARTLIDHPEQSFGAAVQATTLFFKQIKELTLSKKWPEIEQKIHTWIIQGEMIYRWIRLDVEKPLLRMIGQKWKEGVLPHRVFVSEIAQLYLKEHPELLNYAPQLQQRIWILYKYSWYTLFTDPGESSFERFIKWHALSLRTQTPTLTQEQLILHLEEYCKKMIPLVPFDPIHCQKLLNS